MTPEEKAKEICKKYQHLLYIDTTTVNEDYIHPDSKNCAIIAVDEIIEAMDMFGYSGAMYDDFETGKITNSDKKHPSDYWQQVKEEIQKL